jgi:hypothetical protein
LASFLSLSLFLCWSCLLSFVFVGICVSCNISPHLNWIVWNQHNNSLFYAYIILLKFISRKNQCNNIYSHSTMKIHAKFSKHGKHTFSDGVYNYIKETVSLTFTFQLLCYISLYEGKHNLLWHVVPKLNSACREDPNEVVGLIYRNNSKSVSIGK